MRVIILGATSAIAEATARLYAKEGADLLLVARRQDRLLAIRDDLLIRGAAKAEIAVRDLADPQGIEADFSILSRRSAASITSSWPTASWATRGRPSEIPPRPRRSCASTSIRPRPGPWRRRA